MVIPSITGFLWGAYPKDRSLGHRCPPIVIGESFYQAERCLLAMWHYSIHHCFVPLKIRRAAEGSITGAIYHLEEKKKDVRGP